MKKLLIASFAFCFGACQSTGRNYNGTLWESKLGQYLRITHDRQGLNGSLYGYVQMSFDKTTYNWGEPWGEPSNYTIGNIPSTPLSEKEKTLFSIKQKKFPPKQRNGFMSCFSNGRMPFIPTLA